MSLKTKIEAAFQTVLADGGITCPIHQGVCSDDIALPCVIVRCAGMQEEPHGTGNYRLQVDVAIRHTSDPDDPDVAEDQPAVRLHELIDQIQNATVIDTLDESLSAAVGELHIFGFGDRQELDVGYEGRFWEWIQQIELYACETALV